MDEAQENIIKILQGQEHDITILDIAAKAKIDRHTAAKHLEVLKSKGYVEYRNIGKSKVWKMVKDPFANALREDSAVIRGFKNILKNVDDQVSIQNKDFQIVWNNKNTPIKKCYEAYAHTAERCKGCPVEKTFKSGREAQKVMMWNNKKVSVKTQPIKNDQNETVAVVEIVRQLSSKKIQ